MSKEKDSSSSSPSSTDSLTLRPADEATDPKKLLLDTKATKMEAPKDSENVSLLAKDPSQPGSSPPTRKRPTLPSFSPPGKDSKLPEAPLGVAAGPARPTDLPGNFPPPLTSVPSQFAPPGQDSGITSCRPPHMNPTTSTTNTVSDSTLTNSTKLLPSSTRPITTPAVSNAGTLSKKPIDEDPLSTDSPPSYSNLSPTVYSNQFQSMPDLTQMQKQVQKSFRDSTRTLNEDTGVFDGDGKERECQGAAGEFPMFHPPELSPVRAQNLKDVANVLLAIDSFYYTLSTATVPTLSSGGPSERRMEYVRPVQGGSTVAGVGGGKQQATLPTNMKLIQKNAQGKAVDTVDSLADTADRFQERLGKQSIAALPGNVAGVDIEAQVNPGGGGGGGAEKSPMLKENTEADKKAAQAKSKLGTRPKWSNGVVGNVLNGTLFSTTVTQLVMLLKRFHKTGMFGIPVVILLGISICIQVTTGCILVYLTINSAGKSKPHRVKTCTKMSAWLAFALFSINIAVDAMYVQALED